MPRGLVLVMFRACLDRWEPGRAEERREEALADRLMARSEKGVGPVCTERVGREEPAEGVAG